MATQYLLDPVTAGTGTTPLQLSTVRVPCNGFIVQAHPDNTDAVWFGDSLVSASGKKGIRIGAPQAGVELPYVSLGNTYAPNRFDLQQFYIISASASQKVNVLFITG